MTLKQDIDIHYNWLTFHNKLPETVFCNKIGLVLTKHAFHLNKAKHLIWSAIPNIFIYSILFFFLITRSNMMGLVLEYKLPFMITFPRNSS